MCSVYLLSSKEIWDQATHDLTQMAGYVTPCVSQSKLESVLIALFSSAGIDVSY